MRNVFVQRAVAYASSSLLKIMIAIVTLPLMTLYLDPEDYGLFAVAVAVSAVFAILPQLGSSVALAKGFHGAELLARCDRVTSMLFLSNVVGLTAAAVYVLLWGILAQLFIDPMIELGLVALICVAISVLSAGWAVVTAEVLTLDGRARSFALVSVLRDVTAAAVALIALYGFDAGYHALFFGHAAGAIMDILCGMFLLRKFFIFRLSLDHIRDILFDLQLTVTQFIDVGGKAIERIIIAKKLGLDILGIVSHSQRYETIFMALVKSVSRSVWPENLNEAKQRNSDFRIARGATRLIATMCLFASIGLCTIGYDVIGLLSHDKFNVAAYFAAAWVGNVAITTTGFAPKAAAYVHGQVGLISFSLVVGRVASILALMLLITSTGPVAIVVAALLAAVSVKVVTYWGVARFRQIPFQDGRIVLAVITAYAAIVSSIYWGEDLQMRIVLFAGWSFVALAMHIDVIRDLARRIWVSGQRSSSA